ncbi:MAG: hypothetical protein ACOX6X_07335 [Dethiobacteria bacterium]|jgi:hypothetical protein
MKYLITRKVKKLTKDYKNNTFEIVIPKDQMIELAYKTKAANKDEEIFGAYVNLRLGEKVYTSIVEFSNDEVEIIGDTMTKEELMETAIMKGKMFFWNKEICTCWEFIRKLKYLTHNTTFTTSNNNDALLRVIYGGSTVAANKQVLTIKL